MRCPTAANQLSLAPLIDRIQKFQDSGSSLFSLLYALAASRPQDSQQGLLQGIFGLARLGAPLQASVEVREPIVR